MRSSLEINCPEVHFTLDAIVGSLAVVTSEGPSLALKEAFRWKMAQKRIKTLSRHQRHIPRFRIQRQSWEDLELRQVGR